MSRGGWSWLAIAGALLLPASPGLASVQDFDSDVAAIARDVDLLAAPFELAGSAPASVPVAVNDEDGVTKLVADPLLARVAQAVRTHPEAMVAFERSSESDFAIRAAKADLYPTLEVGADLVGNWTNRTLIGGRQQRIPGQSLSRPDAVVSAEQLLFDGGSSSTRVAAARYRRDASVAEAQVIATNVAVRAVATYLEVLRLRQAVKLAEANVAAHAILFERVSVRAQAGTASEGDRLRAEARTNTARSQAFQTEGALSRAEAEYRAVFGAPPGELAPPGVAPYVTGDADVIVDRALMVSPSMHAQDATVAAARKDAVAARGSLWPRVSLAVNAREYDLLAPGERLYDLGAQVIVRYPLFSGGRKAAEAGQAASRLRQAELAREVERRELENGIRSTVADVATRERQLEASRRAADTSQRTYAVYVEQYGIGRRTLDDLLDALNEAYQAADQLLAARVNVDISRYAVAARTGDLLELIDAAPGLP